MSNIYISGPIMAPGSGVNGLPTEVEVAARRRKFHNVAKKIRDNVADPSSVINPLEVAACKSGTNKPVCAAVDQEHGHSWQCYLRYDVEALVMCHEIVLLPGWEGSPGANVEMEVARMLGIDMYFWCDEHDSAHEQPCKKEEK